MQASSKAKVDQVMKLISGLNLSIDAKQKVDEQGFIQTVIFWTDNEKYQPAAVPTGPIAASGK